MSAPGFEVVRQNWYRFPVRGPALGWRRTQGETVLATLPTRAAAESDAATRERAARAVVNPFRCGIVWTDRTEMPEPVFADWVADHDLPDPPEIEGRRDWAAWWDVLCAERSPAHRDVVWGILTNLRLYAVREREPGPRLFVLYRAASEDVTEREELPDGWWERGTGRVQLLPEGGDPVEASLDRARLERQIPDLFEEERQDWYSAQFDVRTR